ncbi:PREDICTED: DNA-directed RNA polymerase I subunit RPA12 [Cyphomyrmex costatus]|uniref:DNA-directed RNA polymerase I subunit RPA12 n=1 Tax=Cyphomyrmex costatus TaxID=456900 RepID=UPI0008523582|nr:PREDICTED: DNA-directed RNA polymerase I subunit RPA12 [Cyphomyrmex costatus]XP_018407185.1 PREDICTED: DNA-directed RNA polymerase I subunit RPA12 [Cyphomyrmex costatus]
MMANNNNNSKSSFITAPGFCPDCGSILPLLGERGGVKCYTCKREWDAAVFGDMEMTYTLHFNTKHTYASIEKNEDSNKNVADGPTVERECPQCNNNKMSYATLQLRSADEGQTVFFTCTKCKFKITENS